MAKREKQNHGGYLMRPEKGETMNPNGRPKKLITQMVEDLQNEGYQMYGHKEIVDSLIACLSLPKEKLIALKDSPESPRIISAIAEELLSNRAFKAILEIIDRVHGKSIQIIHEAKPESKEIRIVKASEYFEELANQK
ncbi:MAG: hypothetical protein RIC03_05610 [Cyclobacteriaceae bacterium]